jgi:flagellar biosynthesis GTPase FlhF
MVHHDGACEKADAWKAQEERNQRYDRMFDKIERHLAEQTAIMRDIARQGEQILTLQRDFRESRRLIDLLFERSRKQTESLAEFRETVTNRFHQHEMKPVDDERKEKLRFSTGAWLLLLSVLLNLMIGWLKSAIK